MSKLFTNKLNRASIINRASNVHVAKQKPVRLHVFHQSYKIEIWKATSLPSDQKFSSWRQQKLSATEFPFGASPKPPPSHITKWWTWSAPSMTKSTSMKSTRRSLIYFRHETYATLHLQQEIAFKGYNYMNKNCIGKFRIKLTFFPIRSAKLTSNRTFTTVQSNNVYSQVERLHLCVAVHMQKRKLAKRRLTASSQLWVERRTPLLPSDPRSVLRARQTLGIPRIPPVALGKLYALFVRIAILFYQAEQNAHAQIITAE